MLTEAELAHIRRTTYDDGDIERLLVHCDALTAALAAERAIADDLAAALAIAKPWYPSGGVYTDWPQALARYRAARQGDG